MRKCFTDTGLFKIDDKIVGINLGFDFCAEHEWGTDRLKRGLGIPVKNIFDNWDETVIPAGNPNIHYCETPEYASVGYIQYFYEGDNYQKRAARFVKDEGKWGKEYAENKSDSILAQWDASEFMIIGFGTAKKHVRELYENMMIGKVSMQRKPAIFGGGGLCFILVDKYPEQYKKLFNDACDDRHALERASEKTGILDRLKAAGKLYFACSPRWKDDAKSEVIYWLNPHDQRDNNCGWYTVADLDQWIAGKGKIPKKVSA